MAQIEGDEDNSDKVPPSDEEVRQFLEENPGLLDRMLDNFNTKLPKVLKEMRTRSRRSNGHDPDPQP